jgi:O-acetyl-ADP-ribose deacetylase (regulator of RNase III)
LELYLRDQQIELVEAWTRAFANEPRVHVSLGDIFGVPADAIVSPANSFGFMDGGIDLVYSRFLGWNLQAALRSVLRQEHGGELPVGQAVVVPTGHPTWRWLVSAPTMRVPSDVSATVHAYLALRAVLRAVDAHNRAHPEPIRSVLSPGLGTAVGKMSAPVCARQMQAAWLGHSEPIEYASLGMAKEVHHRWQRG